LGAHVIPLVRIGRIDGDGSHSGSGCRGDLVAHEREQRRHQNRRPRTPPPQQQRRHEVDRRLAPPGALHHERALLAVDERLDRLELPLVKLRVVPPHERLEHVEGVASGGGCRSWGHPHSMTLTPDRRAGPIRVRANLKWLGESPPQDDGVLHERQLIPPLGYSS